MLILSRFAGAACELHAALIVNPYDREGVSMAIDRALSMPLLERRRQHRSMLEVLSQNDLRFWAENFLAKLKHEPLAPSWAERLGTMIGIGGQASA